MSLKISLGFNVESRSYKLYFIVYIQSCMRSCMQNNLSVLPTLWFLESCHLTSR